MMAVDGSRAIGGGTTKVSGEGKKNARLTGVSAEPRSASNRTLSSILTNRLLAATRVNNNIAAIGWLLISRPDAIDAIDAIVIAIGQEGRERGKEKDVILSFPVACGNARRSSVSSGIPPLYPSLAHSPLPRRPQLEDRGIPESRMFEYSEKLIRASNARRSH